jgi:histidinol-phosphatase (PHP family)
MTWMLVDAHVHLQPHGEQPPVDRARIERYVESAIANGLDGLVFTEHLFRFVEAFELLAGWWNADPDPRLHAVTQAYWEDHVNLRLAEYAALIEEAKSADLPVFLGMEMDWIPGRADDLRCLLAPYDWDLVLGSVHWIGAFGFDITEERAEWERRDVDAVFSEYGQLLTDLADSGLADVLAHSDVPKLWGHRPSSFAPLHGQIVAAAQRNGLALEINTNGLRKPVGELYPAPEILNAAQAAGIPVTLASDAHVPERLGEAFDRAIASARTAGYTGYTRFVRRQRVFEGFGAP